MKDVQLIKEYKSKVDAGANATRLLNKDFKNATPAARNMAKEVAKGTVSVEELTMASKAAAVGMTLVKTAANMAFSLGISLAISGLVKLFDKLIVTEKEAKEQHEELINAAQSRIDTFKGEAKEIADLISQYKQFENVTNLTAEQKEQLKQIQDDLVDKYGVEASSIDLVNGKYQEQLDILRGIEKEKNKQSMADLWTLADEARDKYDKNSGYQFQYSVSSTNQTFTEKQKVFDYLKEIDELESSLEVKTSGSGASAQYVYTLTLEGVDENGNPLSSEEMLQKAQAVQSALEQLRRENTDEAKAIVASQPFKDLQADVATWVGHYQKEVENYQSAYANLAETYVESASVLINGVNYDTHNVTPEVYRAYRRRLIDGFKDTDPEMAEAIAEYLDKTFTDASYRLEIGSMADRTWYAQQQALQKQIQSSTFSYSDYKDQIDEVTKSVSTLSSAYDKLDAGTATTSDLMSLFDAFPELAQYADDTEMLRKQVYRLAQSNVNPLINKLEKLGETVKDPVQQKQLENWVDLLRQMAKFSKEIEPINITAEDYYKYEEDNIQKIIDKLEAQKDEQQEILDSLKAQKEELEDIISEYKQIVDIVGDYIDSSQIEPLENRKSEIEEYYNAQIKKLKEENEERDRNIELQEKQDALANARKTKIRRYDETQGWVWICPLSSYIG